MKESKGLKQVAVTPELAQKWLGENYSKQRHLRNATVNKYASDMENGKWDETIIQPIRFTEEGKLIDGQHRLKAIVVANKTVTMWIQTGLRESAYNSIDIGAKRSAGDIIGGLNSQNRAAIASAIAGLLKGDGGVSAAMHRYKSYTPKVLTTIADTVEIAESVDIDTFHDIGKKIRNRLSCGSLKAFAVAAWIISYLYGNEVLEIFVDDFISDTPFATNLVCRQYIMSCYLSNKNLLPEKQVEIILFAYDKYDSHRTLSKYPGNNLTLKKYNKLIQEKKESENPTN